MLFHEEEQFHTNWNGDVSLDSSEEQDLYDTVPRTNAGADVINVVPKEEVEYSSSRQPMHVLLNLALSTMKRNNRNYNPSLVVRNFIDMIATSLFGIAFPILYFHAMIFPRHFWASSRYEEEMVLGCSPISSYCCTDTHPFGFASHLENARCYMTHSSSSAATDDVFAAHLFDIQCNVACSNCDTRTVARAGFKVDDSKASGMKLGDRDDSELNESIDTSKGMMSLAAASVRHNFDLFVTYTCNQSEHPGIRHLYEYKESKEWMHHFPENNTLLDSEIRDVEMSYEMMYTHVLSRAWLEVETIWIELIMRTTSSMLPTVRHALFRKEYQEDKGNLSHLHALLCCVQGACSSEEFMTFLANLQKNSVVDLMDPDLMDDFMDKGLVMDNRDWNKMEETAYKVLSHDCSSGRCLVRKGPGPNEKYCKKQHPVLGRDDPLCNEWRSIPVTFSNSTLEILTQTGHYVPSPNKNEDGIFKDPMFQPKRHIGACNPSATENMSPVNAEHFAATRSMQNFQVVCGTNGVTRYVVKVSAFMA